jgi:hypothetical protein
MPVQAATAAHPRVITSVQKARVASSRRCRKRARRVVTSVLAAAGANRL